MNIGILYCGYNQIKNIEKTLTFWNDIKLDGVNFTVCVISVPFIEYKEIHFEKDGSVEFIKSLPKNNIQECIFKPEFITEKMARGIATKSLTKNDIDFLWMADTDEYYTLDDVKKIINYLKNSNYPCHSINFKNYIFDGKHYLDDFCAPRINYIKQQKVLSFYDDNQIIYEKYGVVKPKPIPKEVAWIKHLTWLHENGKQKVEFQLKHYGDCSYRWNEDKKQLELDLDFYKRHGYVTPNIIKEDL